MQKNKFSIYENTLNTINPSKQKDGFIAKKLPIDNENRIFAAYKAPEKLITLIVEVPSSIVKFENKFESKGFEVIHQIKKNDNKITQVIIFLKDNKFKEIFLEIVDLFIQKITDIDDDKDFYHILIQRIKLFIDFFEKYSKSGMLINQQQGLFSELEIMEKYFFNYYGISKTLDMWRGPKSGLHDFTIKGTSLEVKSTNNFPALDVNITNENQLNNERVNNLFLSVLEIIRGSSTGESLSEKVLKLREIIDSKEEGLMNKFNELLNEYGYYDSQSFNYLETFKSNVIYFYKIEKNFPRILPSSLLRGVKNVKYRIELNNCEEYIVGYELIKKEFDNVI